MATPEPSKESLELLPPIDAVCPPERRVTVGIAKRHAERWTVFASRHTGEVHTVGDAPDRETAVSLAHGVYGLLEMCGLAPILASDIPSAGIELDAFPVPCAHAFAPPQPT